MSQYLDPISETTETVDYPYLAVRYTPEHAKKESIVFVRKSEKEFIIADDESLVIAVPDATENDAEFIELSRDVIVDSAQVHMDALGYPLCIVFGPDDCVYLEHDGTAVESKLLPFPQEERW